MRRLVVFGACLLTVTSALAGNGAGDAIVKEINALGRPSGNPDPNDRAAMLAYRTQMVTYLKKRNALIWNLFKVDPNNAKTASLMGERWQTVAVIDKNMGQPFPQGVLKDIDRTLAMKLPPSIERVAKASRVEVQLQAGAASGSLPEGELDRFLKAYPKSAEGERLLMECSIATSGDQKIKFLRRYVGLYPRGQYVTMAKATLRQTDGIGKPFDLKFKDAISGRAIDVQAFRGKVVLIDFWATWCGPCVAKMPEMKQLNQNLGPKGLQILAVSLDNSPEKGGLKALKTFVAQNSIPWPQYYQGNGWESKFSASWGIDAIPCVFIIDKKGNLRQIGAPDNLGAYVNKLLAE